MFPGSLYRSLTRAHFAIMTLGVMAFGCVDPVGDFDEYQALAKGKAPQQTSSCLPAPTEGDFDVSGTFVGYCKVNFADPSQALLLGAQFSLKDGVLEATLTPLLIDAPSLNATAGDPPVTTSAPVTGNQFSMDFGLVKISGKANPISGSDIEIGGAVFKGVVVSKDKVLADLDGGLVKPFVLDLNASNNDVCIFLRSPDGVAMPTRPEAADFACVK
jgi:hypothetical protein